MTLQPSDDTFYIKQNNRVPLLQAQLTDEEDKPLNLQFVDSVLFRMYDPRSGETVTLSNAIIDNEANGVVQYAWESSDTNTPGRYRAEFVVRYPSGREESFPNFGYRDILVWGSEKPSKVPVGDGLDKTFPAGASGD